MLSSVLALFCLFLLSVLATDPTIDTIFVIKDTDTHGGCRQRRQALDNYLFESRALVAAGLQAIEHAKDSSAKESVVAKRYLYTYFRAVDDASIEFVKRFLRVVQDFLSGKKVIGSDKIPRLYCDDTWLVKLEPTDIAWDHENNDVYTIGEDGVFQPVSIDQIETYRKYLWELNKEGNWERTGKVPYWAGDMSQYLFDDSYKKGKTYCTNSAQNLGASQEQTRPNTLTLCPRSFKSTVKRAKLGNTAPKARMALANVLPQSGTFYHELYHVVLGNDQTPDLSYQWTESQDWLQGKQPTAVPVPYDKDHEHLIRRNPESYLWFTVGYWYFLQTQWSGSSDNRWSFDTGVAQLISI
ncbi:Uncharacterized protein PECH_003752 [Penicillium ucsense]|uniref:Uncharacterized protein n=2 Tax=Penicillium TaxID=5073 RepID=A0A8J8VZ55_9EURO|nr:uncharacterized protein N7539_005557 [Penicillium diatomitis]KAF7712263.1 Uncharacterized protein PECM_003171 [Penicillium ucsense]KAF7729177.1 Uncharacterized protein PECH_003752 [Penicillium ucsense]KAJ5485569.1 hypothetical protein N7539_005557 [Penicillium diatomitis]